MPFRKLYWPAQEASTPHSIPIQAHNTVSDIVHLVLGPLITVSSTYRIGLAIFQVLKAGFVFSGKAGSGLVIARLPDGSWSAPSCIGTAGIGWGLQIGADITDFVVVLNSEDAVKAFSMGGNVTVGGNISAAAGPIGTGGSVQASLASPAPMFSYSKSKGQL